MQRFAASPKAVSRSTAWWKTPTAFSVRALSRGNSRLLLCEAPLRGDSVIVVVAGGARVGLVDFDDAALLRLHPLEDDETTPGYPIGLPGVLFCTILSPVPRLPLNNMWTSPPLTPALHA